MSWQPVRLFSVRTANAELARLRPLVARLPAIRRELEHTIELLEAISPAERANGRRFAAFPLEQRIRELEDEVGDLAEAFDAAGVLIKDVEMGIVDFPARLNGGIVLLCWRIDEPAIGFWHELEDGFDGRKPIEHHEFDE